MIIGQNLVPNPSFELYDTCPSSQGDFYLLHWSVTSNCGFSSPDYFNICAFGTAVGVPDNLAGTQEPNEGDAYTGIFCLGGNSAQREYIQTQLITPLIAGETYELSFYASLPDNFQTGINNVGAIVTTTALECLGTMEVIPVIPQVKAEEPITDYLKWTLVSGTFIADGGEEFITIGNFYYDEDTDTGLGNPWGSLPVTWSYYYIDSVSLILKETLEIEEPDLNKHLNVYPNPIEDNVYIELQNGFTIESVEIYSIPGILTKVITSSKPQVEINLEKLKSGIYILVVTDSNLKKYYKKVQKL